MNQERLQVSRCFPHPILPPLICVIRICPYHDDQTLDLYCQQCTIPICVKCSDISHKDHPVHQVSQQVIEGSGLEQFNGP